MNILLGSESIEGNSSDYNGKIVKINSQRTIKVDNEPNPRFLNDFINSLRDTALNSGAWAIFQDSSCIPVPDFLIDKTTRKVQRNLGFEAQNLVEQYWANGGAPLTYIVASVVLTDGKVHQVFMTSAESAEFNKTGSIPKASDVTQSAIEANTLKAHNDKIDRASGFTPIPIAPYDPAIKKQLDDAARSKKMMTFAAVAAVAYLALKGH